MKVAAAALDVELCDCFLDYGQATAEMFLLFTFVAFGAWLIWSGFTVLSGVARNYAIPYAIFMFKHNDSLDIQSNGGTSITATKRVGDNGSNGIVGGSLTFLCAPSPAYGGVMGVSGSLAMPCEI